MTGSIEGTTSCATTFSLVNDGLRAVEVEGVEWPAAVGLVEHGTDLHTAEAVMALTPDDISPFAPFTLAGGSGREISLAFPCQTMDPAGQPVVHVRSADLGLRRRISPT